MGSEMCIRDRYCNMHQTIISSYAYTVHWNGLSSSNTSTSIAALLSTSPPPSFLADVLLEVDLDTVGPPTEKTSKIPPSPMGAFRSSTVFRPETLLIPVLSSFACSMHPH